MENHTTEATRLYKALKAVLRDPIETSGLKHSCTEPQWRKVFEEADLALKAYEGATTP